jgi:hypothetical protein
MARMAVLTAALAAALVVMSAPASAGGAGESVQLVQRPGEMPKGSYQQSCQCQLSGGLTLLCFCANIQGRMFQTTMDVRQCPQPKDIRNCNGTLKCTEKGEEC